MNKTTARKPKVGHGPLLQIEQVLVSEVRLSPENDELYRPSDPNRIDDQAMDDSVRHYGILVPLVLTLDNFIVSGHRRFAPWRGPDPSRGARR